MKYTPSIIGITILVFFGSHAFSLEKEQNASIFYDECRIVLNETQIEKYPDLQDNFCLNVETNENTKFIFTRYQNSSNIPVLKDETLSYLKNNYYRGETLGVHFQTNQQQLISDLGNIVTGNYQIDFLFDTALTQYPHLLESCSFNSYKASCTDERIQSLVEQIDKQYSQVVFLDISEILKLPSAELQKNIENNNNIQKKIEAIEIEKNSEYALFSQQYILYRLAINNSILSNRLTDLQTIGKYGPLKLGAYIKEYSSSLQLRQDENFSYFYLGDNRVNTINNTDEHFDELEKKNLTGSNLRQKISDKYTSYNLKDFETEYLVIEKKFSNSSSYIIIDKKTFYRYPISSTIIESKVGKSGLYILTKTSDEDSIFLLSNKKVTRLIATQKEITDFELLIGKIEVTFSDNKTEIIDI